MGQDQGLPAYIGVRLAVIADAPVLSIFAARVFSETFAHTANAEDMATYLSDAYSPDLQPQEIGDARATVFLAEDLAAAQLIGYAHLVEDDEWTSVELKRIYVEAAWQGRGLAGRLPHEVVGECRRRGARRLWLSVWHRNARAMAFYRKCGFRISGEMAFDWGDDVEKGLIMELAPFALMRWPHN